MLGLNASDSEVLEYGTSDDIKRRFRELVEYNEVTDTDLQQLQKDYDHLEEREGFAADLIDELVTIIQDNSKASDIKKHMNIAIDDSYHER